MNGMQYSNGLRNVLTLNIDCCSALINGLKHGESPSLNIAFALDVSITSFRAVAMVAAQTIVNSLGPSYSGCSGCIIHSVPTYSI